ncbi:hypothetical protein ACU4GH_20675 [Bradyrhizobium betae]
MPVLVRSTTQSKLTRAIDGTVSAILRRLAPDPFALDTSASISRSKRRIDAGVQSLLGLVWRKVLANYVCFPESKTKQ